MQKNPSTVKSNGKGDQKEKVIAKRSDSINKSAASRRSFYSPVSPGLQLEMLFNYVDEAESSTSLLLRKFLVLEVSVWLKNANRR